MYFNDINNQCILWGISYSRRNHWQYLLYKYNKESFYKKRSLTLSRDIDEIQEDFRSTRAFSATTLLFRPSFTSIAFIPRKSNITR